MSIEIIEEGLHTTIQDLGRIGYQSYGFPVSGVMDEFAAVMANYLVGNEKKEAVIEMGFIGPTITFHKHSIIALTGANMSANLNQHEISLNRPIFVQSGDVLQLRTAKTGLYGYLAIKGGFQVQELLGSKSTVVRADIHGILGRKLSTGDHIPFEENQTQAQDLHWGLDPALFYYLDHPPRTIKYIKGAQHDWFSNTDFEKSTWKITTQSNRMGYRLEGKTISSNSQEQLLTEAMTFGSIQIPPNGQPIVLMADSQPTGGYPKIGQVIQADLGKLSQIRPGTTFRFQSITVKEARRILMKRETFYKVMKHVINDKMRRFSS